MRWVSQASVSRAATLELMELMVESGCLGHVIGFESLDPGDLAEMHKQANLTGFDRYASVVRNLRDRHLQTWAASSSA